MFIQWGKSKPRDVKLFLEFLAEQYHHTAVLLEPKQKI